MTQQIDTARYRALLLARRDELLALQATRTEAAEAVDLDQTRVGRLSRMDALQGQAMATAGQQRATLQLRRISAALARLEAGDYGYCAACGEVIDPRRLDADPAAPLCIACASKRDS